MRSWKTTASGLVTSLSGLVLFLSTQGVSLPHWLVLTAGFVMIGGFSAMGVAGKDYNVSGTQSSNKDQATK